MRTAKHTPGPWIARPYPESKNQRITITGATSPVAIAEIIPTTMKGYDAIAEANSRLIASAPELHKSTNELMAVLHRFGEWDDGCFYYAGKAATELQRPMRSVCDAIAKAEGQ